MKQQIGIIKYEKDGSIKKKPLWAVPLDDGKFLLFFKVYDIEWLEREAQQFTLLGWGCKKKNLLLRKKKLFRIKPSYTVWYRARTIEECEDFLKKINAEGVFKIIKRENFSFKRLRADGVLNLLGD